MSTPNNNAIYPQSTVIIGNGNISYTSPVLFQNIPLLKGRTLIDKDSNIVMIIDMNGNVIIYPITTNHTFIDKEHNETIIFDSNGQILIYPQHVQICSKSIDAKVNLIYEKINRFNELKLRGVKYKPYPITEEELELRRLYQAIKYH